MAEDNTMVVYEFSDLNDGSTNCVWRNDSISCLLELYKKYKFLFEKFKVKVVYELISIKLLRNFGVEKSSFQCNKKIHNLMRSYKNCLKKPESRHEKFLYFNEIQDILTESTIEENLQEDISSELLEIERKLGLNQSSDHYEEDDYNKSGSLKTWNKDATECLLELYKQYKTLFAHHKSISVFEFLSLKLLQNNAISKKAIDIQRKFNNLTRTYKNCSKGASKQHQRFQYFDSMHEILNSPPSSISLQEKDSMEQEFQEFEMRQNKDKPFKSLEWSEDELLTLVISYLEQFTEEQVDWEVIVMQMQQNDFFRSVDESRSTVKQLLLDYKSMYHFEVDDEHISSYIPELQKVFQNEEELDQAILSLEAEHDSTKILWTSAETLVLINLYQKNGKLFKKQKKGAGWERLSKDLHQAGFPLRPCKTIKQKMDNLKRTYKNVFENDAIYMIKSKKFKFYDSLKPIFEKYEKFWLNGGTEPASENEEEDEGEDNLELEPIKRAGGEVKKRSAWKEIETRILIKEYGNSHNLSSTNIWRDVSTAMTKHHVYRSAEEVSKKWSNMVRTYKKCFPKFLNSGVAPAKFPYFIELKQVFAESAKKAAEWALDEQDEQVNATAEVFADINQEEYILDEKSEVELAEISIPVTKNFWNTLEATSLIKLVKAQQPNKINWSQISRSLRRKSILRTPVECRKKFSNIIRTYLITKAKRKLNASANIHFKYFDLMQETFGDQLPVFHRDSNTISKEKMVKLIELKYHLSQQSNNTFLSQNQWRQISQSLKLNVTPEFLKLNYYNLLKKYKFLSKRKKRSGVQWFYYKEFDKYYNKPAVQCDIEEESLIQEDFEVIYEATNLENSEEKMQFLADNFMDICKVCLEESNTLNSIESSDLINKMNFLFFDDSAEKLDINVANLICNTCLENVENFYKFKRRFKNTADILKDFSKNYTVSSNEPELVNNEPELTTNVNIIDENGTVIEEYQQLDKTEYEEFVDESYVEGAEEMDYNDLIVEAPKEEIDTAYPRKDLQISPKTKKLFKCGHCHKVLKRLESCKSHMRNHLNLRNYGCKICFKTFISHQSLNKHQAVHNKGVVRYQCTECNAGFYRQAGYKRHMATHGIGLKHFCDVCGQGFLFQNLLKEHMISHSEDNKPYHCDNCPKTFGMKRYLRAHIRQFHEKPAQCGSCLGTFSTSFKLKEHIQTQHGIIDLGVVE